MGNVADNLPSSSLTSKLRKLVGFPVFMQWAADALNIFRPSAIERLYLIRIGTFWIEREYVYFLYHTNCHNQPNFEANNLIKISFTVKSFQVAPAELEAVLLEHYGIAEVVALTMHMLTLHILSRS